ncbi:MAG: NADH-quinone oxidoreductase subunit H [Nitriliruptorales bacterium]|nr:NADH-quinone oxidoreductase subunit H [Nitriliruptorales bacterium]
MDGIDVAIVIGRALAAFLLWLSGTALLIWGERRLVARMQTRVGPNRLGPFGLLQVIADGGKMFFKEDITPKGVDRIIYIAAPIASTVVGLLTFAVIPFGGSFELVGRQVNLQVWDPEIGLLWFLAMSSLGVYGIFLGGWASGSKYPLLGGVRSSAQLISYELAMSLSMGAVFVWAGTLRASEIVAHQAGTFFGFLPAWHVFPMIPAFGIFFIAVVAEAQRPPFDLPEAEGELVAGFHTEYSGAKFAMFMLAEFMAVVTMSAMTVTLFFGGPNGPTFGLAENTLPAALLGLLYFVLKVFVFVFVFVWLRGTLPRLRYDRLMDLGWKVMLPYGLVWVMLTGAVVTLQQEGYTGTVVQVLGVALAIVLLLSFVVPLFNPDARETGGGGGGDGGTPAVEPPDDSEGGRALTPEAETVTIDAEVGGRTPDRTRETVGASRIER